MQSNSTNGHAVRAACLYRNSDDKQENSVGRQREGVEPYARKKGYETVAEYVFDGIPGDLINDHPDWRRLLKDAAAGRWSVLLVDEPSRLSRELPEDFIADVYRPLKRAGVTVDSVARGPMDWKTLAGLIMTAIDAHRSSEEVRTLSRRSLAGIVKQARAGEWFGYTAPYGLRIVREFDPQTGEVLGRRWELGPEEEVLAVRFIFDAVANHGWSVRRICRELEARGVKPPAGNGYGTNKKEGRWNPGTVRKMLRNRKYVGDATYNVRHEGKYSRWQAGQVQAHEVVNRISGPNAPADVVVVPEVIPPLIDRDTFARGLAALEGGKGRTASSEDCASYLFTHLLICGDCGSWMRGRPNHGRKAYMCSRYKEYGPGACHRNSVFEDTVRDAVMKALVDEVLSPARLDAIEAEVERRLKAEKRSGEADRIRKRADQLARDIDRGNARLALLPDDRIPGLVAKLREWEGERQGLLERLDDLEKGGAQTKAVLAEARKQLWRLREALLGDDLEAQAVVVREVVSKAEVLFRRVETHGRRGKTGRKQTVSRPLSLKLYVRPGLGLCLDVPLGYWNSPQ
jgi:DNA invertase Pin-like site-specific DNA recombinase